MWIRISIQLLGVKVWGLLEKQALTSGCLSKGIETSVLKSYLYLHLQFYCSCVHSCQNAVSTHMSVDEWMDKKCDIHQAAIKEWSFLIFSTVDGTQFYAK